MSVRTVCMSCFTSHEPGEAHSGTDCKTIQALTIKLHEKASAKAKKGGCPDCGGSMEGESRHHSVCSYCRNQI